MSVEPVVTCYAFGFPLPGKRVFRKALSRAARVLAPSVLSLDIASRSHVMQPLFEIFLILVCSDVESDLPDCCGSPAVPAFPKLWKTL